MNKPRPSARPALGWLLSLTVFALVGSLWAPTAHAEATLSGSNPQEGSTVEASPAEIDMTFSEQIGPLNSVGMTCGDAGFVVALGPPVRLADGLSRHRAAHDQGLSTFAQIVEARAQHLRIGGEARDE